MKPNRSRERKVQQPTNRVRPTANLRPGPRVRKHPEPQIERIRASIERYGFLCPPLISDTGEIIAGVARTEAARRLGFDELPVLVASGMSTADIKAYRIADNKLAEMSSWDRDVLKLEFEAILEIDSSFDLQYSGFDTAEIDLVLNPVSTKEQGPDDEAPAPKSIAVSRVWATSGCSVTTGSSAEMRPRPRHSMSGTSRTGAWGVSIGASRNCSACSRRARNRTSTTSSLAPREDIGRMFGTTPGSTRLVPPAWKISRRMQRLHEDDVTGYLPESPGHGWSVLKVPAIAELEAVHPLIGKSIPDLSSLGGRIVDVGAASWPTLHLRQKTSVLPSPIEPTTGGGAVVNIASIMGLSGAGSTRHLIPGHQGRHRQPHPGARGRVGAQRRPGQRRRPDLGAHAAHRQAV